MTSRVWDVVVVGGGVIGLSTAYHAAKAGKSTLLLEQFSIGHTRGGSHGQSRIARRARADVQEAPMLNEAYEIWQDIERQTGQQLLIETGILLLHDEGASALESTRQAFSTLGVQHECLTAQQMNTRYPTARYDSNYSGIHMSPGGVLMSDKCLQALRTLILRHGGIIHEHSPVDAIYPGDVVTLTSKSRTYQCRHLVLTPGPWANDSMSKLGLHLPFKTMPGLHMYWKVRSLEHLPQYDVTRMPVVQDQHAVTSQCERRVVCVFPSIEYPGMVKVVTRGEPVPFYCHPDDRDVNSMDDMVDVVSQYIATHWPGLAAKPSIIEPGMYTMTSDREPVIDRHPRHNNIIIGAGFLNSGFMIAPLVGKVMHEMIDGRSSYNLQRYRIDRFGDPNIVPSKL